MSETTVEATVDLEDDPKIHPEDLPWPLPKYWRICSNGHLVTDLINSYEVSRGKAGTSFACKRCQLQANARQREKKDPFGEGPTFIEIPDTPEYRTQLNKELEPGPDEVPDLQGRTALEVQLDRIEKKLDDLVADRHPHVATRLLSARIAQLEEEIAELQKGPKEPPLEEMTFDQLKAKASELGIEVPKGVRSAGVRKLIEAHPSDSEPKKYDRGYGDGYGYPDLVPDPEDVEDAELAAAGDPVTGDESVEESVNDIIADQTPDEDVIVEEEPAPRRRRRPIRSEK